MSCRARAAGLDAGGSGQAGGGVALDGAGLRKGSARPASHLRRSDCASAREGWGSPDPGGRTRAWGPSQGSRIRVYGPMLWVGSETSGSPDALLKLASEGRDLSTDCGLVLGINGFDA